ncbi:MAG: hypothetical protein ACLUD2_02425 [Clostridium sp.]
MARITHMEPSACMPGPGESLREGRRCLPSTAARQGLPLCEEDIQTYLSKKKAGAE